MRSYVRAVVRHPAALMITGVLVAYLAFALLMQGRVLPLTVLLLMGAVARLATDNMTVVFLSALTACGLYLVLQPALQRRMRAGREGLASGGEGEQQQEEEPKKKEEEEAPAEPDDAPTTTAASPAAEPDAPTLVEQKISALQTRLDAVQAELDTAAKKL